eukprot:NODE_75_length_3473_cov_25.014019_g67_i0.p1 GENE.NODE_75_length_3473_cov_25.014019_g67_i0~~NODE_75_length_3473_cov_25.014019_g67_i0.p1  ORF type:complete len:1107 (+),score=169.90 NODE_75_length_3473_cov_25.014019_g67_i0:354-3323(+)
MEIAFLWCETNEDSECADFFRMLRGVILPSQEVAACFKTFYYKTTIQLPAKRKRKGALSAVRAMVRMRKVDLQWTQKTLEAVDRIHLAAVANSSSDAARSLAEEGPEVSGGSPAFDESSSAAEQMVSRPAVPFQRSRRSNQRMRSSSPSLGKAIDDFSALQSSKPPQSPEGEKFQSGPPSDTGTAVNSALLRRNVAETNNSTNRGDEGWSPAVAPELQRALSVLKSPLEVMQPNPGLCSHVGCSCSIIFSVDTKDCCSGCGHSSTLHPIMDGGQGAKAIPSTRRLQEAQIGLMLQRRARQRAAEQPQRISGSKFASAASQEIAVHDQSNTVAGLPSRKTRTFKSAIMSTRAARYLQPTVSYRRGSVATCQRGATPAPVAVAVKPSLHVINPTLPQAIGRSNRNSDIVEPIDQVLVPCPERDSRPSTAPPGGYARLTRRSHAKEIVEEFRSTSNYPKRAFNGEATRVRSKADVSCSPLNESVISAGSHMSNRSSEVGLLDIPWVASDGDLSKSVAALSAQATASAAPGPQGDFHERDQTDSECFRAAEQALALAHGSEAARASGTTSGEPPSPGDKLLLSAPAPSTMEAWPPVHSPRDNAEIEVDVRPLQLSENLESAALAASSQLLLPGFDARSASHWPPQPSLSDMAYSGLEPQPPVPTPGWPPAVDAQSTGAMITFSAGTAAAELGAVSAVHQAWPALGFPTTQTHQPSLPVPVHVAPSEMEWPAGAFVLTPPSASTNQTSESNLDSAIQFPAGAMVIMPTGGMSIVSLGQSSSVASGAPSQMFIVPPGGTLTDVASLPSSSQDVEGSLPAVTANAPDLQHLTVPTPEEMYPTLRRSVVEYGVASTDDDFQDHSPRSTGSQRNLARLEGSLLLSMAGSQELFKKHVGSGKALVEHVNGMRSYLQQYHDFLYQQQSMYLEQQETFRAIHDVQDAKELETGAKELVGHWAEIYKALLKKHVDLLRKVKYSFAVGSLGNNRRSAGPSLSC